jgi:hypothetical protein
MNENELSQEPGPVSWKRALLLGLLAIVVVAVVGVAVSLSGLVKNPKKFNEGVGRFGVFVFLVTILVSYLRQSGRRVAAWVVTGSFVGLIVLAVAVGAVLYGKKAKSNKLTPEEKQSLQVVEQDGKKFLKHPYLGFQLLHPGPEFKELTQQEYSAVGLMMPISGGAPPRVYGYVNRKTRENLVIILAKGMSRKKDLTGFRKGFRKSLEDKHSVSVKQDVFTWSKDRKETRVHAVVENRFHIKVRGVIRKLGPDDRVFFLGIMVGGLDPSRLDTLLLSVSFP